MVAVPCLGCGEPTGSASGYCYRCEATRPAGRERLRSSSWRRTRAAYVRLHPLCEWASPPCYRRTAIVDHRVPRDQGGTDAWSNLQSLCRPHHAAKTAQDTAR